MPARPELSGQPGGARADRLLFQAGLARNPDVRLETSPARAGMDLQSDAGRVRGAVVRFGGGRTVLECTDERLADKSSRGASAGFRGFCSYPGKHRCPSRTQGVARFSADPPNQVGRYRARLFGGGGNGEISLGFCGVLRMKKGFGVFLIVLAVLLYVLGVSVLAKEVHYSMGGLWFTLTDGALLGSFLATAVGALAPGAVVHYIGYRLVRSGKSPVA
jgi:hypothetical protein